jgi:hypothetical protein
MPDPAAQLERDGYAFLANVFTTDEIEAAGRALAAALADPDAADSVLTNGDAAPHGARNLLRLWPGAAELARKPPLLDRLLSILGPRAGIVRGLYFDKPAGAGWALPWHRDTTIAVRAHGPAGRFRKPTLKAGVPHVEAPAELLARMVTARIHLDSMTDANGPLRVAPGAHAPDWKPTANDEIGLSLHCAAGDVLLMRPLLLHASAHCAPDHPGGRRVVHLELAPEPELPEGYEWQTFIPLAEMV